MVVKLEMIFRVKLYVPTEELFPVPLKYIDGTRTSYTTLDVMLERNIDDFWKVDGDRDLSDTWIGFTIFATLSEKPPDGYTWSGEETDEKANDLKARQIMARNVETYV